MQRMQGQEVTRTHRAITRVQQDVCYISPLAWEPCLGTYHAPDGKLELREDKTTPTMKELIVWQG